MNQFPAWLAARWAEPSTKAGLGTALGGVAMLLPPTYAQIAIGIGIMLGINAAVKADR